MAVALSDARKLVGKHIVAVNKRGQVISGKLVGIRGNRLQLLPTDGKGKARTKAIIPLVLFDLLAIGTAPYAYGYGYGFGSPFYGGYGYPFFW